MAEAREVIAAEFELTDEERGELLPSARAKRFDNRVAWAKVHLGRAGLLDSPKPGQFRLTDRGREVLQRGLPRIDLRFLAQFPEYHAWRSKISPREKTVANTDEETPEERLELSFLAIRSKIEAELLDKVRASTPRFFEQLVVDLLLKMGYGGSRSDAGRAIGSLETKASMG